MNTSIGSLGPSVSSAYANEATASNEASGENSSLASSETTPAAPETDAVTLSDNAAGAASLVEAAQSSEGIDHEAVSQIKSALSSGSYSVAPEDLAKAIATVLRGSR